MLSYFQVEAPIHCPSFFLFFSLTIKHKTKISLTIKILHLGQGSFTCKVRTIFILKIIVSIFVKLFLILVLHLRQFFIIRIFVKRATVFWLRSFSQLKLYWTVYNYSQPVYKGRWWEFENGSFIYRFELYVLFINLIKWGIIVRIMVFNATFNNKGNCSV